MNATVVDCSALAAVVFEEAWGGEVVPQLSGRRLIAPALLPFELAQVCTTKMRRHPAQGAVLLDQFVAALAQLSLDLEPVGFDMVCPVTMRRISGLPWRTGRPL